ncbi:hypothetical protein LJC40_02830 [Synergistaceae bacterium OttesenSCG-928-D05]|nr:hypothetical protein [Synergistaceae bacterium OttesenSCG-928-D05]
MQESLIIKIWEEELERSRRILESKRRNLLQFPKGSVQKKKINNEEYYYLCKRENGKVKSEYLGKESSKIRELILQLNERKALLDSIRRSEADIRLLEKAVKLK